MDFAPQINNSVLTKNKTGGSEMHEGFTRGDNGRCKFKVLCNMNDNEKSSLFFSCKFF